MRKFGLTVILVLCAYSVTLAQLHYANRLYEEQDYVGAVPVYKKVLSKDSTELQAIERLADSYKKLNKYDLAEKYYAKAVQYDNAEAESYLNYGQLLKNNRKVAQAKEQFRKFLDKKPESLLGKILLQSCDAISEWTAQPSEFIMTNFEAVNSEYLEIGPFPYKNTLIFTSDKNYMTKEGSVKSKKSLDGNVLGIYIYDTSNTEQPIRSFSNEINSMDNIEGPAYFNDAFDKVYYTKVYSRQRYTVNQMEIHSAYFNEGKWVKDDPFKYNNKDYSITNPVLSKDEKFLFFASDMPGGYGGFDIYISEKTDLGYGEPTNLGAVINSTGNEIPSYFDADENLYFSSNFHPGFGGLDLFKSKKGEEWSTPENLKVPFNSSKDDLGFILVDSVTGYFASNRDGGKGLDDIYYFTKHSFDDSSYYTDINGLFLLDTLPMMNMSLALLDENDEIIQMVVTNEKGQFSFSNVPSNKTYKILINEHPEEVPEEAQIYLTDERYQRIMLIERLKKGMFKFEALDRAEYDGLSLMDEVDDEGLPTLAVLGRLSSNVDGTVTAGKKIFVVDDNGKIIAVAVSDNLGKFKFEKLSIDDEYLFKLEEDDPTIDIEILNTKGELIGRTIKNKDGFYVYHKFTINPSDNPDVRGLFKFGTLPADGVTLMLLNEDDDILQITKTNVKGEFEFHELAAGTKYRIKVDSNVKVPGNSSMFLMDKHTGLYLPVSKLANGEFNFQTLSPIASEELTLMEEEDFIVVPRHDLIGQVYSSENKVVPLGTIIQVQDANGKIVAVTKTSDNGMFKFFNLPVEDMYLFGVDEDDPSFVIRVLNENNGVIGEANKNADNQYVYHKFTINPSKRPDVRGIFKYGNLPANDVTLNLLDEADNIIQITQTNKTGEFKFTKLKSGRAYRIEVDSSEGTVPENANLAILDEYTGLLLPVSKLANGSFKFQTLGMIDAEEIALMKEEDETSVRFSFFAQLFSKLPMDLGENLEMYIVDDAGNIIAIARSDKFGKFNFENLPFQDQYLLTLNEDDPNFQLKIIDKKGATIGVLQRNEKGEFVFNRNELFGNELAGNADSNEKTKDNKSSGNQAQTGTAKNFSKDIPMFGFEFASAKLNSDAKFELEKVIRTLKNEPDVKLEIASYTDSRGPTEYNLWLSDQRSKSAKTFITSKGIASDRIITKNYGESELLNECADGVPCSNEKHAINRRTEIKFIR